VGLYGGNNRGKQSSYQHFMLSIHDPMTVDLHDDGFIVFEDF
jgi:hypothetical protein